MPLARCFLCACILAGPWTCLRGAVNLSTQAHTLASDSGDALDNPPQHLADGGYGHATLVADVAIRNESGEPVHGGALLLRLRDTVLKTIVASTDAIAFDAGLWSSVERQVRLNVANPRLWTAEHPNLYMLDAVLSTGGTDTERLTRTTGFRETRVRGAELLMNGIPVNLKGHHDSHPMLGRAVTPELERQDLELIKDASLDSGRTSHYPPLPELLDAADELGVYVEEKASFCWVGNASDLRCDALAQQLTAEMVKRDSSHPAVAYWSAGSESEWGPILDMGEREIRASDPDRPVIGSWSNHFDMTVQHNPMTVARILDLDGNDRPVMWDESLGIFQGIWGDWDKLARDPGDGDYYVQPLVDVWSAFSNSKTVHGSFIRAWSDDLFLVPGRASEYGTYYTDGHGVDRV
jgi:beta-galactosidase